MLLDGDVRSYQHKNILRTRKGRPGTLDDEQVRAAVDSSTVGGIEDADMEDGAGIPLWEEEREHRDGTGETWRTLSWIWTTQSRTPNLDDETDDILQSEWVKSRACANRCKEEVLLLREEMRRVLAFLEWKAGWWLQRQGLREGEARELDEGLRAFALEQSDLQQRLASHFREIWHGSLEDRTVDPPSDAVDNPDGKDSGDNEDVDVDDDDDDEDDNEEEHERDLEEDDEGDD